MAQTAGTTDNTSGISQFLVTGDYAVALIEGLRSEDYIKDSLQCAYDIRDSQIDMLFMMKYFNETLPLEIPFLTKQQIFVNTFFNVTGQLTNSIPDATYTCYLMPGRGQTAWLNRLNEFVSIDDWSKGFFQNLMGNVFTFQSISNKIDVAQTSGDYIEVSYQYGRLLRRVLDFQPVEYAPLYTEPQPFNNLRQSRSYLSQSSPPEDTTVEADQCALPMPDYTNRLSTVLMSYVGFMDGGFSAQNTTTCLTNSIRFYRNETLLNYVKEHYPNSTDARVYYYTRLATQFYPMAFNCYYMTDEALIQAKGKQAWSTNDLAWDLLEETPEFMNAIRTMNQLQSWYRGEYEPRQFYAFFRSVGTIFQLTTDM